MMFLDVVFPLLEMYAVYALNTVTANTILSISTNESCICRNVKNGVFADCLNLGLSEMPGFANNVISKNVSRNLIQHLHGKHLHYLKNLDISSYSHYKNLPSGYCPCMLNGIENWTLRNLKELQLLDISNNRNLGICGFRNVTRDLPFTNITVLKANYLECEKANSTMLFVSDVAPLLEAHLEELYIKSNKWDNAEITVKKTLPISLRVFSATNNRWVWDRYAYYFLQGFAFRRTIKRSNKQTINKEIIYNVSSTVTISFDNCISCLNGPIMPIEDAYKNLVKDCPTYIWIIVVSVCCIITVAAIICAVLVYRFRWKLRYWYYVVKRAYGYHRLTTHDDYQFDAFVSYADNDRYFPRSEMVEHLEKQRGFRLCIHHRDFIAGCSIAENITNAIHNSRKMICLLTEDFMRSDWCKYEFNIATVESTVSRQGQNMIILLMLKGTHFTNIPLEIMLMISEETYIQYPDEAEYKAVFWDRLADSLK